MLASRRLDRRHHRIVEVSRPAFGGYVIAAFNLAQDCWQTLAEHDDHGITGAVRVLCNRSLQPIPLPLSVVSRLRELCDAGPALQRECSVLFRPRDVVRISSGSMASRYGVVLRDNGYSVVRVLVSFLGAERETTFRRDQLVLDAQPRQAH